METTFDAVRKENHIADCGVAARPSKAKLYIFVTARMHLGECFLKNHSETNYWAWCSNIMFDSLILLVVDGWKGVGAKG